MSELSTDFEQQQPAKRSTFLTVLCILTFLGSGWGVIGNAITYSTAATQAKAMSIVKDQASQDIEKSSTTSNEGEKIAQDMVNSMTNAFSEENLKKSGLAGILASVLCLAGAFLMWTLKKNGFYLYVVGTLVGIVAPFVIFGGANLMSIISSVGAGFIGLIFVILYGVNLKHMK
jgi:hypothetical protein